MLPTDGAAGCGCCLFNIYYILFPNLISKILPFSLRLTRVFTVYNLPTLDPAIYALFLSFERNLLYIHFLVHNYYRPQFNNNVTVLLNAFQSHSNCSVIKYLIQFPFRIISREMIFALRYFLIYFLYACLSLPRFYYYFLNSILLVSFNRIGLWLVYEKSVEYQLLIWNKYWWNVEFELNESLSLSNQDIMSHIFSKWYKI